MLAQVSFRLFVPVTVASDDFETSLYVCRRLRPVQGRKDLQFLSLNPPVVSLITDVLGSPAPRGTVAASPDSATLQTLPPYG